MSTTEKNQYDEQAEKFLTDCGLKTKRETNAELRARLINKNKNIIRVKITRNGETHVFTNEPRGDGGRDPWWKLVGYTEEIRQCGAQ